MANFADMGLGKHLFQPFSMRITIEKTTGLVIDIQERLFPAMHNKEALLKNCTMLIRGLQILEVNILVTQQYTHGLGATLPEIAEVLGDFSPFEKRDFSCCGSDDFNQTLKLSGASNILLCGIESHVCVLQTAVDLKQLGYFPIVVLDAVSSRFPHHLDLARERYRHEGIMMTSTESVLFELTRSSSSPQFKAISQLVK